MKKILFVFLSVSLFCFSCIKLPVEKIVLNPPFIIKENEKVLDSAKDEPLVIEKEKILEKPAIADILVESSHEKHGWGLSVTTDETTPGIPDSYKKLLAKFNGFYIGPSTQKKVFLTFDCGYEAGYTNHILDILTKNNVPAIFFIAGHYLDTKPDLVKKMVELGFTIGNHTTNHPSLPDISEDEIKKEILGLNQLLKKYTGKDCLYLRPPGGEFSEYSLGVTKNLGYKTIFWSLAFKDWVPLPGGAEESYQTVMKRIHPGAIILLHIVSKDDSDALQRIVDGVRAKGYEFVPMDF